MPISRDVFSSGHLQWLGAKASGPVALCPCSEPAAGAVGRDSPLDTGNAVVFLQQGCHGYPTSPRALNTSHCPENRAIFTYPKFKQTPQTPKCKLGALALVTGAGEEKPFLCFFLHLGLTCGFSSSFKSLFLSFTSLKQSKA